MIISDKVKINRSSSHAEQADIAKKHTHHRSVTALKETIKSHKTNPIWRVLDKIITNGVGAAPKLSKDFLKFWALEQGNEAFYKLIETKLF